MSENINTERKATSSMADEQIPRAQRRPILVLEKCCFCCIPLRTGSLILAYLFLIGLIVNLGFTLVGLGTIIGYMFEIASFHPVLTKMLLLTSVVAILNLVALPFNVCLLVGLHKEKPHYVRNYINFQIVCTVLTVLQEIVSVSTVSHIYTILTGIIVSLLYIAINVYYLLVLRSHYLKMMANSTNQSAKLFSDGRPVNASTA